MTCSLDVSALHQLRLRLRVAWDSRNAIFVRVVVHGAYTFAQGPGAVPLDIQSHSLLDPCRIVEVILVAIVCLMAKALKTSVKFRT